VPARAKQVTDTESQGWSYVEASFPPDRMVSALGNGVKEGQRLPRKTRAPHPVGRPGKSETPPMRKPATGEPCAGEPHARFGGRGGESLPYPYPGKNFEALISVKDEALTPVSTRRYPDQVRV
jgi:hypothetical protein